MHIGQKLGLFKSELNEDDSEDLQSLGNYDPKTQEKFYSTKLPMKIICSKAAFLEGQSYELQYTCGVSCATSTTQSSVPLGG